VSRKKEDQKERKNHQDARRTGQTREIPPKPGQKIANHPNRKKFGYATHRINENQLRSMFLKILPGGYWMCDDNQSYTLKK